MNPVISREVRLASHSRGRPVASDFELTSTVVSGIGPGQMLIRNSFMSVDAYMRGRVSDIPSLVPAFQVGQVLEGAAVGEVVTSAARGFAPGDAVTSMYGWREYFVASPMRVRRIDRRIQPLSSYLGVLGTAGLTAWAGLSLAEARPREHVFISGASGAVGSVAGQLAKLRGCHVSGSTRSGDVARMLVRELGFDSAFGDDLGALRRSLAMAAPEGVDVYLDNVGAELGVVLAAMRPRGRIVLCGAGDERDGLAQLRSIRSRRLVASKGLTMQRLWVSDWLGLAPVFQAAVGRYLADGRLRAKETIVDGLEHAADALIGLSLEDCVGKVVVKLS